MTKLTHGRLVELLEYDPDRPAQPACVTRVDQSRDDAEWFASHPDRQLRSRWSTIPELSEFHPAYVRGFRHLSIVGRCGHCGDQYMLPAMTHAENVTRRLSMNDAELLDWMGGEIRGFFMYITGLRENCRNG